MSLEASCDRDRASVSPTMPSLDFYGVSHESSMSSVVDQEIVIAEVHGKPGVGIFATPPVSRSAPCQGLYQPQLGPGICEGSVSNHLSDGGLGSVRRQGRDVSVVGQQDLARTSAGNLSLSNSVTCSQQSPSQFSVRDEFDSQIMPDSNDLCQSATRMLPDSVNSAARSLDVFPRTTGWQNAVTDHASTTAFQSSFLAGERSYEPVFSASSHHQANIDSPSIHAKNFGYTATRSLDDVSSGEFRSKALNRRGQAVSSDVQSMMFSHVVTSSHLQTNVKFISIVVNRLFATT